MNGKYVAVSSLGAGGMGRVDLAIAKDLGGACRLVVLKRLKLDAGEARKDHEEALIWEARLSARLHHPNVAETLDLELVDDELMMVVEYLDGVTVRDMFVAAAGNGAVVPRRVLLRIVNDALAGLAHAHGLTDYDGTPLGIVHRDISPANLAVTAEGLTKVLDFGVAKAKGAGPETPLGFVKGKLRYMAPEQILGESLDGRTDLFAIGMTLWEGLTGERLGDLDASVAARVTGSCPSIRSVRPELPEALDDIVSSCLARELVDRPKTALDLALALEPYAGDRTEVSTWVRWTFGAQLAERRQKIARAYADLDKKSTGWTNRVRTRVPSSARRVAAIVSCALCGAILVNVGGTAPREWLASLVHRNHPVRSAFEKAE